MQWAESKKKVRKFLPLSFLSSDFEGTAHAWVFPPVSEKIPLIENPFCLAGDKTFSFHWLRNSNSICIIRLIFPALFPASLSLIRRDKGNSHEHEPCLARRCSLFAIKAPLSVAVFGKISNCERRKKKCLWKRKGEF